MPSWDHIWRRGNLITGHILGGRIAGRTSGALLLKLIPSSNLLALIYEVKIIKPHNVQLLELQGICLPPEYMGGLGGWGLFVSTLATFSQILQFYQKTQCDT